MRTPALTGLDGRSWGAARRLLARPELMVFAANMLRSACAFAIGLLVARKLGPAEFGLFTTFTVVTIWAHSLIGEGFDPGVVRLYARHHDDDPAGASAVLGSALVVRALLVVPMLSIFWMLSARWFGPEVVNVARVGAITAIAASFATLSLAILQAQERFVAYAVLTPLGNLLRLSCLPMFWWVGLFGIWPLIWAQAFCLLLLAAFGMSLLRADLRHLRFERTALRELIGFGKWTAVASLCFALQTYMAVPVLAHIKGASAAGLYSAAATLLLVIDQFTIALLTVKLPSTSRIDSLDGLRSYVRNLAPRLLLFGFGLLLLIPFADVVVSLVYGHAYADSAAVMRALLPGFVATLVSHPLYLVLYSLDRPHGYAASGVLAVLAWCALAAWLIPGHGVLGAAWATTGSRLLQAVAIITMVLQALRHRPSLAVAAH